MKCTFLSYVLTLPDEGNSNCHQYNTESLKLMYRYKTWFLSSLNSETITSKSTDLKFSVILSPSWKKCVHWQKCVCLTAKSTSCSYHYNKGKETQQTTLFYMQHQKKQNETSICNWNCNEKAAKCDHKHATDLHKHHPITMHPHEASRNIIFNNGA